MEKYIRYKVLLFFCAVFLVCACSPTRYVKENEYLLSRMRVKVASKEVAASELRKTVRQRPNTRILGVARFHLGLYNLSGRDEKKRFNRWLRDIGEAPVIYSPFLTERSVSQMELYLNNKGYYQAEVTDSVWFKNKKAYVEYRVDPGFITKVEEIRFHHEEVEGVEELPETAPVRQMIYADTVNTSLYEGMPMNIELLENERERITNMLRNNGYFNFSRKFIQYYADTLAGGSEEKTRLLVGVINSLSDSMAYRRYIIDRIRINLDYDPMIPAGGQDSLFQHTNYGEYDILYRNGIKIKPKVILETIQFMPGELYDMQKVATSYSRLQALNLFKFINIIFREKSGAEGEPLLDCEIQLTPMKRQAYNVFLEGTNNSGNIGVGGNFSYNHRNLFQGGENLTFSFWGALRKEKLLENGVFSATELGAELKFVTPQFWLPVLRLSDFRRNYAPKTSIALSFNSERTQFYNRRVASAKFGYLWRRGDNKWRYNFDLFDLNYVIMSSVDSSFINELRNEYVKSAYTNHLLLSANYSATYTDQDVNKNLSFNYFKGNLKTSGNFLMGIDKIAGVHRKNLNNERYYEAFGVRYAQFVKADGEYRFHHYINKANTIVYRFFLGCGYPYGNMRVLPFEEAYYCGGANDIRAWHSRTLGPGTYSLDTRYPNSVGDFKMEANIEYRFKLFWLLEGALFLDAGNIWNINKYENRPGAQLSADFYEQLAVGTGVGLRLDVSFFLLRFDLGIKMRDPSLPAHRRFVLLNSHGGFKKSVFNIGIGYPF